VGCAAVEDLALARLSLIRAEGLSEEYFINSVVVDPFQATTVFEAHAPVPGLRLRFTSFRRTQKYRMAVAPQFLFKKRE
jgi:hypothetical protein